MKPIQGLHHVTAIAGDPQRNVDFYHTLLGQRLIKKTVNFDDPGTYHFYFGDHAGSPGTIMTFFPWPGARRGQPGNGEVGAVAYAIDSGSLSYWRQRLVQAGMSVGQVQSRFGQDVLPLRDPDGMAVELVVESAPPPVQAWEDGPIPVEHVLRGFHSVTLWVADAEPTAALLVDHFGYRDMGREGSRWRLSGGESALAGYVDLLERPQLGRGRLGAGSVHHVAFRVQDEDEELAYQRLLRNAGFEVTPVRDRQYFRSVYFREPGGVLFELATNPPGFTLDESLAKLGQGLRLPPWLEPQRQQLESSLPPITTHAAATALGA